MAFGPQKLRTVTLRGMSAAGATVQIRLDNARGPLLAEVAVPKGGAWQDVKASLTTFKPGTHALYVAPKGSAAAVAVDWVRFE